MGGGPGLWSPTLLRYPRWRYFSKLRCHLTVQPTPPNTFHFTSQSALLLSSLPPFPFLRGLLKFTYLLKVFIKVSAPSRSPGRRVSVTNPHHYFPLNENVCEPELPLQTLSDLLPFPSLWRRLSYKDRPFLSYSLLHLTLYFVLSGISRPPFLSSPLDCRTGMNRTSLPVDNSQ